MVHVVCTQHAAVPIKSLSPELIVIPALASTPSCDQRAGLDLIERVHVLSVGSGLGRNEHSLAHAAAFIKAAKAKRLPIVIDGDALWHVSRDLSLVQGYDRLLLTPNVNEFKNLAKAVNLPDGASVQQLAERLAVAVLQKGQLDKVCVPNHGCVEVEHKGSPRRVAGQGDILAGVTATFMAWAHASEEKDLPPAPLVAGWAASTVTRTCAERAFSRRHRGTITSDLLEALPDVFQELFPVK